MEASWNSTTLTLSTKIKRVNARPYSSEQAIPTLEELVGVSDFDYFLANSCFNTEEDKSLPTDLLNVLRPLTLPASIEEENQRGMKVILCAAAESYPSTINHDSMDGSDTNVLLTRAERRQSMSRRKPHLERDLRHTVQCDASTCSTQSHISENVTVSGLSEVLDCFFLFQNPTILVSVCMLQGRHQFHPAKISAHGSTCALSPSSHLFSGW